MMRRLLLALALCLCSTARAADAPTPDNPAKPAEEEVKAKGNAPPPPLEAIVHGFFLEMRTGLGWEALGAKIPADPIFPQLGGQPEQLGLEAPVDLAIGYEIIEALAIQLVGGMHMVTNQRPDRVRGLNLAYAGIGVRLAFPLRERLNLLVSPNLLYTRADTVVDPISSGLGAQVAVGFEYYVHVRHISLGVNLTGTLPFAPVRLLIAVEPHIRYTF